MQRTMKFSGPGAVAGKHRESAERPATPATRLNFQHETTPEIDRVSSRTGPSGQRTNAKFHSPLAPSNLSTDAFLRPWLKSLSLPITETTTLIPFYPDRLPPTRSPLFSLLTRPLCPVKGDLGRSRRSGTEKKRSYI